MKVINGARKAFWMGEAPNMPVAMNENQSSESTPDQLLQMLDLQIAMQRGKRRSASKNRAVILAGGLILILGGMAVALLVLQQLLLEVPRSDKPQAAREVGSAAL